MSLCWENQSDRLAGRFQTEILCTMSNTHNFSFISSALAYGGGGGGGGGGSFQQDKISYKVFNICMKEKGYFKDENGLFELPRLTCG